MMLLCSEGFAVNSKCKEACICAFCISIAQKNRMRYSLNIANTYEKANRKGLPRAPGFHGGREKAGSFICSYPLEYSNKIVVERHCMRENELE